MISEQEKVKRNGAPKTARRFSVYGNDTPLKTARRLGNHFHFFTVMGINSLFQKLQKFERAGRPYGILPNYVNLRWRGMETKSYEIKISNLEVLRNQNSKLQSLTKSKSIFLSYFSTLK